MSMQGAGPTPEPSGAATVGRAGLTLLDGVSWCGSQVPGERAHALLAALALYSRRGLAATRLVEEIWGDEPPAHPGKALQVLVSRVRAQTHTELVVRTETGYRLGVPDAEVDAHVLRDLVAAARQTLDDGDAVHARRLAEAALAVPMGEEPADPDSGPLARLRADARRSAEVARLVLGTALSILGEHAAALALLEDTLAVRPGDEAVLAPLLRTEAAVRGVPLALDRYERHRRAVRARLGTDPGEPLQRLHAELLAHDAPVREGILFDASPLVGRSDDVAAVRAMLQGSRVVSITGPGGLGKTRLAHVVGRLAEQPVVHFVELAGVTSPEGVVVEVASALEVRDAVTGIGVHAPARNADLRSRIIERIGAAPALLILDNCEHVVDAVADLVAVLVSHTRELKVLTTSRAPLGVAAERAYPLPQLGRADAATLFAERATAARPGVALEPDLVRGVVERLDGLPLAIELAAAKVRVMSVEEISRRLEDRFALLRGGGRDAPRRHRTLLAVIDWSWNLLKEPERVALRRLSVFRDGFSLDAAAAVLSGTVDALTAVEHLVEQSLLAVHESGHVRYRLLETVREFGRVQLVDAGEVELAEHALRRWATGFCDGMAEQLSGRGQIDCMRLLRSEEGNLSDVLRRAVADGDRDTVVVLADALGRFWSIEGSHPKLISVAGGIVEVLDGYRPPAALGDRFRGTLCSLLANSLVFGGSTADWASRELARVGASSADRETAALATVLLAITSDDAPRDGQVLGALCASDDGAVARIALHWTSHALENSGDIQGAIAAASAARDRCDETQGPWARAALDAQLAGLSTQAGDLVTAERHARRALEPLAELQAFEDHAQVKALLALCDMKAGRLEAAERAFEDIADEQSRRWIIGGALVVCTGRAELAFARAEHERGLRLYREAFAAMLGLRFPGLEQSRRVEPWVLYSQAGALAAHARHGRGDEGMDLNESLLPRCLEVLAEDYAFLDYPVTGAAFYAVALWQLTRPDAVPGAGTDRAVRLLALADRFSYNRMLPCLDWECAAAVADQLAPGRLASCRAELAGRAAPELRADARRLLTEL